MINKTNNMNKDIKIFISGYGRMGRMVESVIEEKDYTCVGKSEDIASTPRQIASESVCVDFTVPDAFRANYKFIAENFKAAVIGTTGWDDIREEVFGYFRKCGTPIVWASNFSLGVNVFSAAVELVSKLLSEAGGYTPYIVEKHHCHKWDAPSGTAKTLASVVEGKMGINPETVSIRAGEIAGIHTVSFEGLCDRLTFEHEAFTRKGFAEGAVLAASKAFAIADAPGQDDKLVYEFKEILLGNLNG